MAEPRHSQLGLLPFPRSREDIAEYLTLRQIFAGANAARLPPWTFVSSYYLTTTKICSCSAKLVSEIRNLC